MDGLFRQRKRWGMSKLGQALRFPRPMPRLPRIVP